MSATFSFETSSPSPMRRSGIAAGIAVSLVLHLLLIFGYRISAPAQEPYRPAKTMTVWLQPPKPPQQMAKLELPPPSPKPESRKREKSAAPSRTAPTASPAPVIAVAPTPAPSQAITLPAPDPLHPELQPKKFDMNAALKTARQFADEKDPARANMPVAQLDNHPLYPEDHETKLQKGIASAKKYDCKDAGAGAGLLAPLIWAFDKHCKF